jgi:hypothetical protein
MRYCYTHNAIEEERITFTCNYEKLVHKKHGARYDTKKTLDEMIEKYIFRSTQ